MKLTLVAKPRRPAVVVVGAWDPILPGHLDLFQELCAHARSRDLTPLVVVIAPDPGTYLHGRDTWPVYTDAATRWRTIQALYPLTIAQLRFTRADLFAGAADFFRALDAVADTREIWLGARQSLGSGPDGGPEAVQAECAKRQITLRELPAVTLPMRQVRRALIEGRVVDACELVGRPPLRRRPAGGLLRLAWHPGRYTALPLETPLATPTPTPIAVTFERDARGLLSARWPDDTIPYLAFVRGPGDAPDATAVPAWSALSGARELALVP